MLDMSHKAFAAQESSIVVVCDVWTVEIGRPAQDFEIFTLFFILILMMHIHSSCIQ